ncbi:hypothetical protein MSKU15_0117 [Komagataeibacter diospyri]|nr:hypothetical protein MSKU15_0117 [Komagataeibacter diospyri]
MKLFPHPVRMEPWWPQPARYRARSVRQTGIRTGPQAWFPGEGRHRAAYFATGFIERRRMYSCVTLPEQNSKNK